MSRCPLEISPSHSKAAQFPLSSNVCENQHHLSIIRGWLLFTRADESTVELLADCIAEFGTTVGLHPNLRKSNIYLTSINNWTKDRLLQLTGFLQGTFLFWYLIIPLATEKLRIGNYGALADVVLCKFTTWPNHTLSYEGNSSWSKLFCRALSVFDSPSCRFQVRSLTSYMSFVDPLFGHPNTHLFPGPQCA